MNTQHFVLKHFHKKYVFFNHKCDYVMMKNNVFVLYSQAEICIIVLQECYMEMSNIFSIYIYQVVLTSDGGILFNFYLYLGK